jgi:hypothetical protein
VASVTLKALYTGSLSYTDETAKYDRPTVLDPELLTEDRSFAAEAFLLV